MASSSHSDLPALRRCHHCRAWQRDKYELCLFCGRDLRLNALESAVRLAPLVILIVVTATSVLVGTLCIGESTAASMAALTLFVCTIITAVVIAPRGAFKGRTTARHRPTLNLKTVRRELKDALGQANAQGDSARVTGQLTLVLWGLTLLREGNRAAPLLYGRTLARDHRRSHTDTLKKTIERLNQLDREWVSNRLTGLPEARPHLDGLTALLKAVKARPRRWLERLSAFGVGEPMPFVDIEPRLVELRDQGDALRQRAEAAATAKRAAQDDAVGAQQGTEPNANKFA